MYLKGKVYYAQDKDLNEKGNTMKLLLLFICLFFNYSQVFACLCVGETTLNEPENSKNEIQQTGTAGWGYFINNGDEKYFKFLACFNRANCSDLLLSKNDLKLYQLNLTESLKLLKIQSYFNSFEEGLNSDIKKNVEIQKMPVVETFMLECHCPITKMKSLEIFHTSDIIRKNLTNSKKIFKGEIEINKEMEGCGCETLILNDGENLFLNAVKTPGKYNLEGHFYENDGKLFFKEMADNVLKKTEKGSLEIRNKSKCNPIAKYILNKQIVINSYLPFEIVNHSIDEINLCKVTIVKK